MRSGTEMDTAIAELIFGNQAPVRPYSTEIEFAWQVATRMGISLIPIENDSWFALVGSRGGWKSPQEFVEFLQSGEFAKAGAAVGAEAPEVICLAALNAIQSRKTAASDLN